MKLLCLRIGTLTKASWDHHVIFRFRIYNGNEHNGLFTERERLFYNQEKELYIKSKIQVVSERAGI